MGLLRRAEHQTKGTTDHKQRANYSNKLSETTLSVRTHWCRHVHCQHRRGANNYHEHVHQSEYRDCMQHVNCWKNDQSTPSCSLALIRLICPPRVPRSVSESMSHPRGAAPHANMALRGLCYLSHATAQPCALRKDVKKVQCRRYSPNRVASRMERHPRCSPDEPAPYLHQAILHGICRNQRCILAVIPIFELYPVSPMIQKARHKVAQGCHLNTYKCWPVLSAFTPLQAHCELSPPQEYYFENFVGHSQTSAGFAFLCQIVHRKGRATPCLSEQSSCILRRTTAMASAQLRSTAPGMHWESSLCWSLPAATHLPRLHSMPAGQMSQDPPASSLEARRSCNNGSTLKHRSAF